MAAIAYSPLTLNIISVDFRPGINGRPDNIILNVVEKDEALWVPVWDDAEFDIVDKLLDATIPEDGMPITLRHRVNEQGFDDYRLTVDARAAAKAARKRRMAIETAQAVAAE